jgi:quercetin dioxygenase-like cupin family protein
LSALGLWIGKNYVDYDKSLTRPAEVDLLCGDAIKSKQILGFEPKVKFKELVKIMMDAEMKKLSNFHEDNRRRLHSFPEAKLLEIKEDCVIGEHYHKVKTEKFILCEGQAELIIQGSDSQIMEIGKIYTVLPEQHHTFHVKAGSVLVGLNSTTYDPKDDYK